MIEDIIDDIAFIYRFFGPNNNPIEGIIEKFIFTQSYSEPYSLKENWEIIRKVLMYTNNKQLVFHVTHLFFMKVFYLLYWTYGSQQTIKNQYFTTGIPILQQLLLSPDISKFINKVKSLLRYLINNYEENDLYINDSGVESDCDDCDNHIE